MSLKLYMDHNSHGGIVAGLRKRGIDLITAESDGMADADDEPLLQRAADLGRVVFTQDVDFIEIAGNWIESGRNFAGVIYARQMGLNVGVVLRDVELIATVLEPEEMRNWIERVPLL